MAGIEEQQTFRRLLYANVVRQQLAGSGSWEGLPKSRRWRKFRACPPTAAVADKREKLFRQISKYSSRSDGGFVETVCGGSWQSPDPHLNHVLPDGTTGGLSKLTFSASPIHASQ